MALPRSFALVRTVDQWMRCAHADTAIDADGTWVELATVIDASQDAAGTAPAGPAGGLTFDPRCRLYHAEPEQGRVESLLWQPDQPAADAAQPVGLFAWDDRRRAGDFTLDARAAGPLDDPRALAAVGDDRLFIAEAGRHRVLVYDLFNQELLSVIRLGGSGAGGPRPIDLASCHGRTLVLTENPARILELDARGVIGARDLPAGVVSPTRLAMSPGGRLALLDPGAGLIFLCGEDLSIPAFGQATDLEFESESVLVVARWPGQDFRRVAITGVEPTRARLRARGYDGRGIARTPDGRIGFWTGSTFRLAIVDRRHYVSTGTVTTYRLDSGDWQTTWGRVFLDVCLPEGSSIRIACAAADEPPDETTLARTPPSNAAGVAIPYPEQSPPMPPLSFVATDDSAFLPLYRRGQAQGLPPGQTPAQGEEGRELVWPVSARDDSFITIEAPAQLPPERGGPAPTLRGRYLWLTLRLTGDGRVTPRVRCARAEFPAHDTLRRLPKLFSADPAMESFLQRYLAPQAGFLNETDAKSVGRSALLNPDATPDAALPWLASFLGLVLDERWASAPRAGGDTVDARRQLIAEANCLFRLRGTVAGLKRFIEIYTGFPVIIFEQFRARGLGGVALGAAAALAGGAVVGTGLRVGAGAPQGPPGTAPVSGDPPDAFRTYAHRFSVLVPAVLTDEQLAVIQDILTIHRPAHTLFEICAVGLGARLNLGMHLAISSFIGKGDRFQTARVGGLTLGRGSVLGRPRGGTPLGTARLGAGARIS